MLAWVAIPYVLFSTMATKMPGYVMIAAPAMFIIQADFWLQMMTKRDAEVGVWRKRLLTLAIFAFALLPARYLLSPTGPLERRERNPEWVRDLRALNAAVGPERAVLFNVPTPIEAMFYTPYVAYSEMPSDVQACGHEATAFTSTNHARKIAPPV
jgi:4-amino-4-deoxy-L-arabinose transferase-like glycosyltransferase